ncbi:MAG: hypothetical protein AB7Q92_33590 [Acidimicrobiia bacterium]
MVYRGSFAVVGGPTWRIGYAQRLYAGTAAAGLLLTVVALALGLRARLTPAPQPNVVGHDEYAPVADRV